MCFCVAPSSPPSPSVPPLGSWLRKQQERSPRHPLAHQEALQALQTLIDSCVMPNVVMRFKATKDMDKDLNVPVVPFMLSLSLRSEAAAKCHQALALLDRNASLKPSGVRLRPERGVRDQSHQENHPKDCGDLLCPHLTLHASAVCCSRVKITPGFVSTKSIQDVSMRIRASSSCRMTNLVIARRSACVA